MCSCYTCSAWSSLNFSGPDTGVWHQSEKILTPFFKGSYSSLFLLVLQVYWRITGAWGSVGFSLIVFLWASLWLIPFHLSELTDFIFLLQPVKPISEISSQYISSFIVMSHVYPAYAQRLLSSTLPTRLVHLSQLILLQRNIITTPTPSFTSGFILGVVQYMGLDKSITSIHHYSIIHRSHDTKNSPALPIHPCLPLAPGNHWSS